MITKKLNSPLFQLVTLIAFCSSAQASLDGDEMRIEYHFPVIGEVLESDTVVVGPGPEITCSSIGVGSGDMCDVNYGNDHTTFYDVGSNTISVGWSVRGAFVDGNPFNGMVFADLDTGGDLADVTYQCNDLSGAACVVDISFENNHPELGDYIAVNFSGCTPTGVLNCNPVGLTLTLSSLTDNDQDGIENSLDNCVDVSNAGQIDTDSDGYGNACDGDFNNDCVINFIDFAAFSGEFLGTNALFDLNNDGIANFLDFAAVANSFLMEPGPGLGACDGL